MSFSIHQNQTETESVKLLLMSKTIEASLKGGTQGPSGPQTSEF